MDGSMPACLPASFVPACPACGWLGLARAPGWAASCAKPLRSSQRRYCKPLQKVEGGVKRRFLGSRRPTHDRAARQPFFYSVKVVAALASVRAGHPRRYSSSSPRFARESMGALCSCCSAPVEDETTDSLLNSGRSTEPVSEARRKAADAALRRAGSMAHKLRPQRPAAKKPQGGGGRQPFHEGMRWTAD